MIERYRAVAAVVGDPGIAKLIATAAVQVADLLERLPAWRERDDFVAPLPVPTVKEYERELPEHAPPPLNPDWDPWDFRCGPAADLLCKTQHLMQQTPCRVDARRSTSDDRRCNSVCILGLGTEPLRQRPRPATRLVGEFGGHYIVLRRTIARRAYVEKKKRKARERAAWEASMAEVGRFEYLSVTADNDIRLKPRGEPAKEWTDDEIWDFITLKGAAVDPRLVKGLVRVRLHAGHLSPLRTYGCLSMDKTLGGSC